MFKSKYRVYGVWRDPQFKHHVEVLEFNNITKREAINQMYHYLCHDKSFKQVSFRSVIKVFAEKITVKGVA